MSSLAVSTPAATRTILIVDDDPSVTETFERMLRLEGYHVVTALSAEAGLSQAERSQPRLRLWGTESVGQIIAETAHGGFLAAPRSMGRFKNQ